MNDIIANHHLDTKGLRCPEPIMMLHRVMRKAQSGECIEVIATDPSTSWDIPKFCIHLGHELLEQQQVDEDNATVYRYLIRKG